MNTALYFTDVFTPHRFNGAQIAVFPHAAGLSTAQRATLANEVDLWASVFVEEGDADGKRFRLQALSPKGANEFGTHTAVAAATVLAETGQVQANDAPVLLEVEEQSLTVFVNREPNGTLIARMAQTIEGRVDPFTPERPDIARMVSLDEADIEWTPFRPYFVYVNSNRLIVPVRNARVLRQARCDVTAWRSTEGSVATSEMLLISRGGPGTQAEFIARLIGPGIADREDPPVGAAIPELVTWLCAHDHVRQGTQSFTVQRGSPETRISSLQVEMDNHGGPAINIRVGGNGVVTMKGEIAVP